MPKKEIPSVQATDLRRRAENTIRGKTIRMPKNSEALSPEYMRRTLHELQVHQIELEMQNENLRQTQVELEASRTRYFDLYDLAPVGYFTLSEEGLILEINLTAATMLGVARSALIKKPLTRFILPEDQNIYNRRHKLLVKTGATQVCELRMVRVDAALCWVRIDAIAGEDADGTPLCRATMIDITERKQANDILQESNRKLKTLVENIPQKIFIKNRDLVYLSVNKSYALDFGITAEEFESKTDYVYFPKELADKYRADDKRIMESGYAEDIEEQYI